MKRLLAALMALGSMLGLGGPVAANPSELVKRCEGEFATLRGVGGLTFATVGECARYAGQGGAFVPSAELAVTQGSWLNRSFLGGSKKLAYLWAEATNLIGSTARWTVTFRYISWSGHSRTTLLSESDGDLYSGSAPITNGTSSPPFTESYDTPRVSCTRYQWAYGGHAVDYYSLTFVVEDQGGNRATWTQTGNPCDSAPW